MLKKIYANWSVLTIINTDLSLISNMLKKRPPSVCLYYILCQWLDFIYTTSSTKVRSLHGFSTELHHML